MKIPKTSNVHCPLVVTEKTKTEEKKKKKKKKHRKKKRKKKKSFNADKFLIISLRKIVLNAIQC